MWKQKSSPNAPFSVQYYIAAKTTLINIYLRQWQHRRLNVKESKTLCADMNDSCREMGRNNISNISIMLKYQYCGCFLFLPPLSPKCSALWYFDNLISFKNRIYEKNLKSRNNWESLVSGTDGSKNECAHIL